MDWDMQERIRDAQNWRPVEEMDRTHRWLMRCIGAIVVIVTVGLVWSIRSEARAQGLPVCKPEAELRKELLDGYREVPIGAGIASGGRAAIVIYVAPDGDTFTITVIRSDGQACIIAAGDNLDIGKFPVGGEES